MKYCFCLSRKRIRQKSTRQEKDWEQNNLYFISH